mmetsp:Transcript_17230/g.37976  ORF Transcript_17230/g.37976 Transcript_17230/m.37976 type:complete len:279 (-) Transcript_17230:21-857(-)
MRLSVLASLAAAAVIPTKPVAPGVDMPLISLGTGGPSIGTDVSGFTAMWLEKGFKGIDTANGYKDQPYVAKAISEAGMDRKDLFITTKVPGSNGYAATVQSVQENLQQLQTSYLDLLLIHFPQGADMKGTWQAFEELYANKTVRALGVSNFMQTDLEKLLAFAKVKPVINQCQHNILAHMDDLIAYCEKEGIYYEAYQPLGRGSQSIFDNPTINQVAVAHNVSAAQVAMRWIIQQGHFVTVQAGTSDHQDVDTDVFSFKLTDDEVKQLDALQGTAVVI